MSSLPEITAADPIVLPARAEKTFPHLFLGHLVLRRIGNEKPTERLAIEATLVPWNKDTGEFPTPEEIADAGRTGEELVPLENLWPEVARCALVEQVAGGLVLVVKLIRQERALLAALEALPEDADRTALETELAAVRQQLGVR